MDRNVQNGTPLNVESICMTCRWAVMRQGLAVSQRVVVCCITNPNRVIQFPTYRCTGYDDRRLPSRYDMEQIAWILVTDPKTGRKIGFVRNDELQRQGQPGFAPPAPIQVKG